MKLIRVHGVRVSSDPCLVGMLPMQLIRAYGMRENYLTLSGAIDRCNSYVCAEWEKREEMTEMTKVDETHMYVRNERVPFCSLIIAYLICE